MNSLIATYSRVSTSHQEEEQTIQIQITSLREFAGRDGHTIVREYTDDGWSGDTLIRPALDQLRQDARKKMWDAVLIYDPDRLARRYSYQELVMDELREAGIEVMFITVPSPKNSEEKILHGVRGLFAEYERAKIAERFRLGKLRKVKDGHVLTTEAPYGYTYIPKHNERHGYYEINPAEASVVRRIFTWIASEGLTTRKVVLRLQQLGITPRKSKRGVWNTSTLATMLRNSTYIGRARWGVSYAVIPRNPIKKDRYRKLQKTSRRIKPKEEWIASEIQVPAIIDKELFEQARAQLTQNASLSSRNRKYDYLLSGKIRCVCGRTRSGAGPQRGKHRYYRCNDRTYSFPIPPSCKEKGINATIADRLVWMKIAHLMRSPELLWAQTQRWLNSRRAPIGTSHEDANAIVEEITKLQEQIDRYSKAYGVGAFDLERLKRYTTPLHDRIASLKSQMQKNEPKDPFDTKPLPSFNEIKALAANALTTPSGLSYNVKRSIIATIVDRIVATATKLEVFGYIPITLNNVAFKTDHRHGLDSMRHDDARSAAKVIPFSFTIKLPPPQKRFGNP